MRVRACVCVPACPCVCVCACFWASLQRSRRLRACLCGLCGAPAQVYWSYEQGTQVADTTYQQFGDYYGRLVAHYVEGGFLDEYGVFVPGYVRWSACARTFAHQRVCVCAPLCSRVRVLEFGGVFAQYLYASRLGLLLCAASWCVHPPTLRLLVVGVCCPCAAPGSPSTSPTGRCSMKSKVRVRARGITCRRPLPPAPARCLLPHPSRPSESRV